jgi:DNA-binding NtrC family response regulator
VVRAVTRLEIDPDPLAQTSAGAPADTPQAAPETSVWARLFGRSERMRRVADHVRALAGTERPVLIEGETGTGKERVAEALHALSSRCHAPFVKVRCAALAEDLVELELFGYEPSRRHDGEVGERGQLELARGGSLLLDDIGVIPFSVQAKLVHLIDEGAYVRPGGWGRLPSDARIVAVTRRDLARLTIEGRFSEELYARLAGAHVVLPPLRERPEEIAGLAEEFRDEFCRDLDIERGPFARETLELMLRYRWPGNVRELENFVKRYIVLGDERSLQETLRRA